jgi:uncharacterized protein (TIGR02444 family)
MADDDEFWNFSLTVYDRAKETALALQDRHGLDVNFLLFCCWRASEGYSLSERDARAIVDATRPWWENVVEPLRSARRWLKNVDRPSGTESLRQRILELELDGERLEQSLITLTAMDMANTRADAGAELAAANLDSYRRVARVPATEEVFDLLSRFVASVFPDADVKAIVAKLGYPGVLEC